MSVDSPILVTSHMHTPSFSPFFEIINSRPPFEDRRLEELIINYPDFPFEDRRSNSAIPGRCILSSIKKFRRFAPARVGYANRYTTIRLRCYSKIEEVELIN